MTCVGNLCFHVLPRFYNRIRFGMKKKAFKKISYTRRPRGLFAGSYIKANIIRIHLLYSVRILLKRFIFSYFSNAQRFERQTSVIVKVLTLFLYGVLKIVRRQKQSVKSETSETTEQY